MPSNKIAYLPAFPFGELHFSFLKKNFPDFTWSKYTEDGKQDLVLIDSNAWLHYGIKISSPIIYWNPILTQSEKKKPWFFKISFLRNALIQRMQNYQVNSFLQSYSYPNQLHELDQKECYRILQNEKLWEKLILSPYDLKMSYMQKSSYPIYLITNTEDPLRNTARQTEHLEIRKKLEIPLLPHGILATNKGQITQIEGFLKTCLQDLSQ